MKELSPKQERFCEEYLIDLNGTQAAIRAGYSKKTANEQAARLLANVSIASKIDELRAAQSKRTLITADRVLTELAKIAFSDMRKFSKWGPSGVSLIDSESLSDEDASCIAEVSETTSESGGSIKFKIHDKKAALELLGKHLKLFTDKVEHSGKITLEDLIAGSIDDNK